MQGLITGKGIFTDRADVKPNTVYYIGSMVPASKVKVTRIESDRVYYVSISNNRIYSNTNHECMQSLVHFANSVAYANKNMREQLQNISDSPINDYLREEITSMLAGTYQYDLPQYKTFEEMIIIRKAEQDKRNEINAKTKTYTVVETAKLARNILKESFPGVKFSVRSESYSGGSSINVSWVDGPTTKQVNALIGHMKYGSFDGMEDLYSRDTNPQTDSNGTLVRYGNHYMFTQRDNSAESIRAVWEEVCKDFGWNSSIGEVKMSGDHAYLHIASYPPNIDPMHWFNQALHEKSFYNAPQKPVESVESGVVVGDYKGNPVITLPLGKGFTFGKAKAKAILAYIEEIKQFAESD